MGNPPFEWPNRFLVFVLGTMVVAVIAPWFIPRARRSPKICIAPAIIAIACWFAYEWYLGSIAPVGDPLIRIDWFLLLPLTALDLLSAVAANAMGRPRPPAT